MTAEEIADLIKQSEFGFDLFKILEGFARLVAKSEREACAKVVEREMYPLSRNDYQMQYNMGIKSLAKAIRSRA